MGKNIPYELDGRRQQFISEMIGGIVAMIAVALNISAASTATALLLEATAAWP